MKIETERLLIKPLTNNDGDAMLNILQDFENSPASSYDYPRPVQEDKINMLLRYWVKSGKYFMIYLKDTKEICGFLCYEDDEVGFNIHTSYQRQGIGYEALTAFIEYMHSYRKKRHFTAQAALENISSVRLLEKAGFLLTGTEYISFRKNTEGIPAQQKCGNFTLEI